MGDGCSGCVAHTDGPLYAPYVGCLSLLGPAQIELWDDLGRGTAVEGEPMAALVLRHRSLHVLSGSAYSDLFHGIRDAREDLITERCANAAAASVAIGDVLPRGTRRLSLVFVHKWAT